MAQKAVKAGAAIVADRIRSVSRAMTPAEQKIARILFSSAMLAGLGPVASLAERAGVSGPSVIRLTSKLGFDSYPKFQAALRAELEERGKSPLSLYAQSGRGKPRDFLARSAEVFTGAMRRSFARVSPAEFDGMVAALCDVKRPLYLAGGRFTQLIAEILFLHLFQMRPGVRMLQDGLQMRKDQLLGMTLKSVLLIADFRRYQADSVSLARAAKDRGASVLLITDPWESPIAEFADHVLIAEVAAPSPYDSMVPAFALAEALIGAAVAVLGPRAISRMRDLESLRGGFEYRGDERPANWRGKVSTRQLGKNPARNRSRKRSTRHG